MQLHHNMKPSMKLLIYKVNLTTPLINKKVDMPPFSPQRNLKTKIKGKHLKKNI